MKKLLTYAVPVLALFTVLTSCSKEGGENQTNTYDKTTMTVKTNGADVALKDGQSAAITETSNSTADISVTGLITGAEKVEFKNVVMTSTKSGDCTFNGEAKLDTDRTITLSGTRIADKLALELGTKITSPVVGKWDLDLTSAIFSLTLPEGHEDFDAATMISAMAQQIIPQLLAQKVTSVEITFLENGTAGVSFVKTDGTPMEFAPGVLSAFVNYYVRPSTTGSQLCVTAGKEMIAGMITGMGIPIDLSLFPIEESNGNYIIPLKLKVENNIMSASIDKPMIEPFLPTLKGILANIPPDEDGLTEMAQGIIGWIDTKGATFEVGLKLNKAQ